MCSGPTTLRRSQPSSTPPCAALVEPVPEREWIRARIAPLVGLATEGAKADRMESFTAWRRFIEAAAAARPLVLVVEDLHWADPVLLEFLDHLTERTADVPLLVVATARRELLRAAPGLGSDRAAEGLGRP